MTDELFRRYDIRGKVPEEINSEKIYRLGRALAHFYNNTGNIVVGRDGRESSPRFYRQLSKGLKDGGCTVTQVGIATTDMISYMVNKKNFDGGANITASHMPPNFGGVKALDQTGKILHGKKKQQLEKLYKNQDYESAEGEIRQKDLGREYINGVIARYNQIFEDDLKGLKIVVDPGHSVSAPFLPEILVELGAEVETVNENIHHKFPERSPEPEKENIKSLKKRVESSDADMGVATDGDADRAVFVNEKGEYIPGDHTLALLGAKYLEFSSKIICTINSSGLIEEVVGKDKVKHVEVGDILTDGETVFGGEPNGHLMDSNFTPYDSGCLFTAVVAGLLIEKDERLSLMQEKLPQRKISKKNLETDQKHEAVNKIEDIETEGTVNRKLDTVIIRKEQVEAKIRSSGSEPIVRVTLEGEDEEEMEKLLERIRSKVPGNHKTVSKTV
ncbi:MAG: hypothetical protein H8Z69_01485 [Nanohaloarchaea archaeon]|nr:hypothetical protein [Candidatus Nanohaloarchaea archaeon]